MLICAGRRGWEAIKIEWSVQKQAQRQARGLERKLAKPSAKAELELKQVSETQIETNLAVPTSATVELGSVAGAKEAHKPAPNHPWRKMAIGRAKYQINPNFVSAKN